ncbi:unannotated protein [freshwater metagenome]|uniref:Unannotated protein n=1 Tax=freshwater metagenome TaxID=449393 RepID=A0A6J7GDR8_9ZZZZ
MWCRTIASSYSVGDISNSAIRNGVSIVTSKPLATNSCSRPPSSCRSMRIGVIVAGVLAALSTTCSGDPSTSGYTVRSVSCRSTTSANAADRALTSSGPLRWTENGRLYTAVAGSNRLRNHMRCCAGESGMRSGRSRDSRIGVSDPRPAADSARAASAPTVGASNSSRTPRRTPSAPPTRVTNCVAISELPPSSKKSSSRPTLDAPSRSS